MKKIVSPFTNNVSFNYSSLPQIIVDEKLIIIDINSSFLKIMKYKKHEMVGKQLSNFADKRSFSVEVDKMDSLIKREKSNFIVTRNYLDKFNNVLKMEINLSIIKDPNTSIKYFLGMYYPQEKIIAQSENNLKLEDLKLILKKSPVIQWVYDIKNSTTIYENRNLLEYLGFSIENLSDSAQTDLFLSKLCDKELYINTYIRKIKSNFKIQFDIYNNKNEVKSFISEIVILNKDINGDATLSYGATQDITKRKQNEIIIQDLQEKLNNHNKKLKEQLVKIIELENFASIASHYLKEPIRTIRNYTQILTLSSKEDLDSDGKELISLIKNSTERMYERIEAILSFSKITSVVADFNGIDIKLLIKDVLNDLDGTIKNKKSSVLLNIPKMDVFGEKNQLRQLFQNLISNAIKFSNNKNSKIEISLNENKGYWHFTIKDNGIGIPKEELSNIFKMFNKLHLEKNYGGHGIGLAICKRIIERHQGEIWVESEINKGSVFHFTISKNC